MHYGHFNRYDCMKFTVNQPWLRSYLLHTRGNTSFHFRNINDKKKINSFVKNKSRVGQRVTLTQNTPEEIVLWKVKRLSAFVTFSIDDKVVNYLINTNLFIIGRNNSFYLAIPNLRSCTLWRWILFLAVNN